MSKIKIFLFLPECYGDTRIVTFFNIGRGFINHAEGIHKVAKAMKSQVRDYHKILIGLVDNDKKNVSSYFNDFVILKEIQSLMLRHKPETQYYLLILNPELESWILESAASVTILPTDYNLPSTAKELHKITSKINVAKNTDFTNFLKAIYQAQAENFITLQNWIEELISN